MPCRRPGHTDLRTCVSPLTASHRVPPLLSCHRDSKPVASREHHKGRRLMGFGSLIFIRGALPRLPGHIRVNTDSGDDLARRGDTDVELGLRLDSRGDSRRPHLHRAIATWPRQPMADDVGRPPANGRKAEAPLLAVETRHCEGCDADFRPARPPARAATLISGPPAHGRAFAARPAG